VPSLGSLNTGRRGARVDGRAGENADVGPVRELVIDETAAVVEVAVQQPRLRADWLVSVCTVVAAAALCRDGDLGVSRAQRAITGRPCDSLGTAAERE
jgi:hypothetical protein